MLFFVAVPFFFLSTRFSVAVLAFFGMLSLSAQHYAMKLVLPCMVNETYSGYLQQPTGNYRMRSNHFNKQPFILAVAITI